MLKTSLVAIVVLAALGLDSRAEAQVMSRSAGAIYYAGTSSAGPVYTTSYAAPTPYPSGYVATYSYYATPYPYPARQYVGGYSNDFPFYGHPYGHAYDAYTWSALSSYPSNSLARYYYPPVQ